tara:strand:- start:723 stop:1115 length:393 start_codon:yes stop_codon:yes gene_type:complete
MGKIIYVDVDETICYYQGERNYNLAIPYRDRIERINKLYDDLSLRHESGDIFRFVSHKYTKKNKRSLILYLHAGMQTFKASILKEYKYKEGYVYDNRSDTLFLTEIFNKYKNMCVIDENLIQYVPGESYK